MVLSTPSKRYIYFTPDNTGYILFNGEIIKSTDNGENWIIYKLDFLFRQIFFISENIGFSSGGVHAGVHGAGGYGDLFYTSNGGETWRYNFGVINYAFSAVLFLNETIGFLVTDSPIYKSTDQGINWTESYINNSDSTGFSFGGSDISILNEDVIWVVGRGIWPVSSYGAAILGSVNGGDSWDLLWKYPDTEEYSYRLNSCFNINSSLWAVGSAGLVVNSVDSDSFNVINVNSDLPLSDVFFSDENHGWIAGGYINSQDFQSTLLKTINGGESWKEIRFDKYLVNDMYFIDSLHGWVVGKDTAGAGMILETLDGGEKWNPLVENLSSSLTALHFKYGFGWAVGGNGLILKTGDGISWIDQNTGKTYPVQYNLFQNYPNPFNPITNIEYRIQNFEHVQLTIYNLLGKKVATLVNNKQVAGNYNAIWDASGFASGIYYYRLKTGNFEQVKKMVLIK